MTTPSSDPFIQFGTDFNKLGTDAVAYWNDGNQETQAQSNYTAEYNLISGEVGHKDPEILILMFIYLFCNQGFTQMDLGVQHDSSILTVQGDLNKLYSDLESMTNYTPATGATNEDMAQWAKDQDQVLFLIDPSAPTSGPANWPPAKWPNDPTTGETISQMVQAALGGSTDSQLVGYAKTLRATVFDHSDPTYDAAYNPNGNVPIPPSASGDARTYWFDTDGDTLDANGNIVPGTGSGAGYLGSFGLLNSSLSQSGDPYQSTEGKQALTNGFNEVNSSLNTGSSYSQEVMQNLSKIIQAFQAFTNDMAHYLQSIVNQANQAGARASQ